MLGSVIGVENMSDTLLMKSTKLLELVPYKPIYNIYSAGKWPKKYQPSAWGCAKWTIQSGISIMFDKAITVKL